MPKETINTKITIKKRRRSGQLILEGGRIYFQFGFWKALNAQIRLMQGRKYHGYDDTNPKKWWSIPSTPRNLFQLAWLTRQPGTGGPFEPYDTPLQYDFETIRPLYDHQKELLAQGLTRHYCIWAAEMGTGKTLSAIELAERVLISEITKSWDADDWRWHRQFWWVGPKSALLAVKYEFEKWDAKLLPQFMTYQGMTKIIKHWDSDAKAPRVVIFDESSRVKTPTAQRSRAALALADGIRQDWAERGYVIEMSGSPAPKSPADWWHQCEVACPGFLVEGDIHKFKAQLGIIHERENPITGGKYPHLVSWRDSVKKCNECGQLSDADIHIDLKDIDYHAFIPCINEVDRLYKRLQGLVMVKFKKDCLDLPEKQYKLINIEPTPSTLRAAQLIAKTSPTAIRALTLLRELSDGFQYVEEPTGKMVVCPVCSGTCQLAQYFDDLGNHITEETAQRLEAQAELGDCPRCKGTGEVAQMHRTTLKVPCPKDDVLRTILSQHEEVGRLVIYAGFQGSIDRVCAACQEEKWEVIRVDGRGWYHFFDNSNGSDNGDLLPIFQTGHEKHPRIAFVGQPSSAGMGLTLTASPTVLYFSNDFNAESRIQSEDRIHRPGMDSNRGATIIDLSHLQSDDHVLANLQKKRDLQAMSLGALQEILAKTKQEVREHYDLDKFTAVI